MAAQDAELKLKVSLDLAYLQGQLATVGNKLAGQPLNISVKFDRRSVQNELNALGRNISQRTYRLEVATNIAAEIKNAEKLARLLREMPSGARGSAGVVSRGFGQKAFLGIAPEEIKKLYKAAADAGLLSFNEGIANNKKKIASELGAVGKDSIQGLLNGMKSKDSSLQAAAKSLGKDLIQSVKNVLGIASPSREFKKIGEFSGEGLEAGFKESFPEAARVGVRELQELFRKLKNTSSAGIAELRALMLGGMAGVVQFPGSFQQRGRFQQVGGGINAAMRGAAGRQAIIGRQTQAASAVTPTFMSALPLMMGMSTGDLARQYAGRTPGGHQGLQALLVEALGASGGRLGGGNAGISRVFGGASRNPGVLPAGYIGRTALSPAYVNYPPGMPPAYPAGFAGAPSGRFLMGAGPSGRFPTEGPLQRGIGAGAGSFVPLGEINTAQRQFRSLGDVLGQVRTVVQTVSRAVAGDLKPALSGLRTEAQAKRKVATQWSARGGMLGGIFVAPSGGMGDYRGGFPTSGMAIPSSPYGQINAQTSMFGPNGPMGPGNRPPGGIFGGWGRGFPSDGPPSRPPSSGGGMGGFGGQFGGALAGINLPGAGVVREVGQEFAFAAKQVLLFGTTYKALAFLQSFPGQVIQAAASLQSYENSLRAVTKTNEEFSKSSQFVLGLVDKYNIPLQAAEQGFVKLYASMRPAGFEGNQIRDLFTGISKASATLGLSSDKVDRVTYAFSQMASKGQLMSEEVSNQLGDVIPGALSIMASAAGMDIATFKKAMEDGVFVGDKFKKVMLEIPKVLDREFGAGAEGAAKTIQGSLNRMSNSVTFLYRAFEPVAVNFLNTVVTPLTAGLKTITDGFNAFFTQTQAKTAGGMAFAQELEKMKPTFEGLYANIRALIPSFQIFGSVLLNAAKFLTSIAGNPIIGFLLQVYTNVLLVNTAFKLLGGQILLGLIASVKASIAQFVAMNLQMTLLAVSATNAGKSIAGTQLQMFLLERNISGVATAASRLAMLALGGKIALIAGGLVLLGKAVYDTNEIFRNFVNNIGDIVATDFRNAVDEMSDDAQNSANDIEKSYKDLTAKLEPIGQFIRQLFKGAFGDASDSAQASATQSTNSFNEFFNSLSVNATEGFNGLSAVINKWWANLPEPIRRIFEGNALSTLVNAGKYVESAASRAAAPNAQATGMYGRYVPGSNQQKIIVSPSLSSAGGKPGSPLAGGGGDAASTKERQKYISDVAKLLQNEMQQRINQINQDASLSDREREIQAAAMRYNYEMLINKAEYSAAVNDENKKDILNRQQYLDDLKKTFEDENKLSAQRYEDVVTSPLRNMLDEDRKATIELEGALRVLGQGRTELTNVESRQIQIKQALNVLDEETIKRTQPLIDLILQTAAVRDKLTEAEKKAREEAQKMEETRKRLKDRIATLRQEIALLMAVNEEERKRLEIQQEFPSASQKEQNQIYDLKKVKENIAAVRATIDSFVTDTASDYKGFLKAVISGEDAVDALKKFQEGLKDRVLTIFLDFAMKPVENIMKELFTGMYMRNFAPKLPSITGEKEKATATEPVEATNQNTNATNENTTAIKDLTNTINTASQATQNVPTGSTGGAFSAPAGMDAASVFGGSGNLSGGIFDTIAEQMNGATESFENFSSHMSSFVDSTITSADSFGSWSDSFGTTLSDSLTKTTENANEGGSKLSESLGKAVQGIGIAAGAIMGIAAGISQIKKGGTSNILGGIGSIFMSLGGAIGGFMNLGKAANGAVWTGGFQAFANGGTVSGPTLGLIGEGKYNEAIVPLPDGKSIPVSLGGGIREKMNAPSSSPSTPMLSMSFETTSINGIEYVSRDQLEQAMMETRKLASKEGAQRGANLAIDRLQQSPNIRRRVGMR